MYTYTYSILINIIVLYLYIDDTLIPHTSKVAVEAEVFANTTWLHPKCVEQPKKRKMASTEPDDVAALIADAEARGRIWHEDQAGMTWEKVPPFKV